jgi:hypothetical protein
MASDLAFLVLDRAPLRGMKFRVLLYMAMQASRHDICYAPHAHIAGAMRMTKRHAQECVAELIELRLVERIVERRNFFLIRRDRLWVHPPQTFQGSVKFNQLRRETFQAQMATTISAQVSRTLSLVSQVQGSAKNCPTGLLRALSEPEME